MVKKLIKKGRRLLSKPQTSVLSAAAVIMLMIIASRVLGLIRQRTLAHFFEPEQLSLFFAAFRLPDLIFEVLVFGTFSSAFIPVFTKSLSKGKQSAWRIASTVVNLGLLIFVVLALIVSFNSDVIYSVFAPGFDQVQRGQIVRLTRILFAAQGFFVVSYVLTGVLESLRRFLVPALAPLFYNIGIILGTILLNQRLELLAPTLGVLVGAFSHFLIQLPLAYKLGFRFSFNLSISDEVKKIGRLALPRVIEVSFLQIVKVVELFFSSIISTAAYTYFTFGNTLQLLPVGLFGTSIAKAALPTLSRQSDEPKKFSKTLLSSLYQLVFLTAPVATILIVLRIPIIRLVYGTDIFSWEATVQTGYVLSAFAFGVVFQSASALLARSFYAINNTKTPVTVSVAAMLTTVVLDFVFVGGFGVSVWGLAAAFSIGSFLQACVLFYLLNKRVIKGKIGLLINPIFKVAFASFSSGTIMFLVLKVFDRSVWVKRLSFLGKIESTRYMAFERFVLDTRYTVNLLVLTLLVSVMGGLVYLGISLIIGSRQVWVFFDLVKRIIVKRKMVPIPAKEPEPVAPTPTDSSTT
jgi:putative peptidoglycan lipid II flippase